MLLAVFPELLNSLPSPYSSLQVDRSGTMYNKYLDRDGKAQLVQVGNIAELRTIEVHGWQAPVKERDGEGGAWPIHRISRKQLFEGDSAT